MAASQCAHGAGFRNFADQYDAFILDQYGVLHNGGAPLEGARECLQMLQKAGIKVVLNSNSGQEAEKTRDKLISVSGTIMLSLCSLDHTVAASVQCAVRSACSAEI